MAAGAAIVVAAAEHGSSLSKRTHPQAICGLTKHIAQLTGALKQANGALMACQSTLIDERDIHAKEIALLRARLGAQRARHGDEIREKHTKIYSFEKIDEQNKLHCETLKEKLRRSEELVGSHHGAMETHEERLAKAMAGERLATQRAESLEQRLRAREDEHVRPRPRPRCHGRRACSSRGPDPTLPRFFCAAS